MELLPEAGTVPDAAESESQDTLLDALQYSGREPGLLIVTVREVLPLNVSTAGLSCNAAV